MAAARRELGGGVRQHPGSNNCVEGAYGIARFDRREPVESDEHARSTCGVRELRDSPVRRSVGQRAAAARRPTSIVCWWRTFVGGERAMLAVPRIGAARRRALRRSAAPPAAPAERRFTRFSFSIGPCPTWPPRSSGRPTRHSPSHGDISAGPSRSSGRPTRHSPSHGDISAGPPRSSGRPTRHSPPHGDIDDADVAAAAAGRAARLSYGVLAKAWC